jgi:sorbitol-6-phosphate 2-dehydrogenase
MEEIMDRKLIEIVAPVLRGAAFDGEKGKIVVVDDQEFASAPEGVLSLELSADEPEDKLSDAVIEAVKSFSGDLWCVALKGQGRFFLGESYDEAMSLKDSLKPLAKEKSSATNSRDNIVRNKVAVVTGGAQGFGEGIVRELVSKGALVFIADMNLEGAGKLAEELNLQAGATVALPAQVNVTDENSVADMVFEIVKKTGGIDIFVNNAGVLKAGSVKELPLKDFGFVTDVNYTGYFLCVKYTAKVMERMNRASGAYYTDIIQINSKSGLEGSNKNGAYAGGKFGGIGLTQSFALELVADNTKVNSICPGNFFDGPLWSDPTRGLFVQYLNTGKVPGAKTIEDVKRFYESKVPMNRGCSPEDVAKAIYYAVEQKYETGQAIPVTGGQVMLN